MKTVAQHLPLLLLPLALAACTGDIVPRVKAIDTATLGLSQNAAPPVEAEWWKALGDPQLDSLVDAALAGNPTLDEALARLRSSEAGLSAARSQQFPQVAFDANEQREQFSNTYIIPPP